LKFPAEIRKAIYTTNAIESVNRSLRKISKKPRRLSPSGSAAQTVLSGFGSDHEKVDDADP